MYACVLKVEAEASSNQLSKCVGYIFENVPGIFAGIHAH